MKTVKSSGLAIFKRRRSVIIAAVTLVVLVIGGYVLWSMNTWNSYKTTYESWQKELHTDIDEAIAMPSASSDDRTKKIASFKDISNTIASAQGSLCTTPAIITWQHFIGTLREREAACNESVDKADSLGKKLQATISYLESEHALAGSIAKVLKETKSNVTEKTWGSQASAWASVRKEIESIPSPESTFNPVKASAIEKTKAVESAWLGLVVAHKAKDKTKYEAAQAKLATVYEALSSLSTQSAKQLNTLTSGLQTAYQQAFTTNI